MAKEHIKTWGKFKKILNRIFVATMIIIPALQVIVKIANDKGIVSISLGAKLPTISTIILGLTIGGLAFYIDVKVSDVKYLYKRTYKRPIKPPPPPPPPRKIY